MPYKLKPEAAQWGGPAGVPWRDLSDEEFAEASAQMDAQFPDQPGSLLRWFEPDKKATKPSPPTVADALETEGGI